MGKAVEKEWFYLTLGHRRGPVTFEEFCEKIATQEVYIDSTQVWKQGMKKIVYYIPMRLFFQQASWYTIVTDGSRTGRDS